MTDDVVAFKHAFCPECGPVENADEDCCCLMCGADVIVGTMFDELMDAKEKAEGQLCRAREFISNAEFAQPGESIRALLVISEHAPCPHAEDAKRLREALMMDHRDLVDKSFDIGGWNKLTAEEQWAVRTTFVELRRISGVK